MPSVQQAAARLERRYLSGGTTDRDRRSPHPLVDLCRLEPDEPDPRPVLRRVTELCCAAVPDVDAASVVLGPPTDPELVVSSSAIGQAADGAQVNAGAGPTLDAYASRRSTCSADAWADPRWPALARWPVQPAVHGVVAVPLFAADGTGGAVGVLTGYRMTVSADGGPAVAGVAPFVARTEALVRFGRTLTTVSGERDQLTLALTSRATIDQAKGVLMAIRGGDADAAFDALKRWSNRSNRRVRDVAEEIVGIAVAGGASALREWPGEASPSRPRRRRRQR
jgi:hypothetical protein